MVDQSDPVAPSDPALDASPALEASSDAATNSEPAPEPAHPAPPEGPELEPVQVNASRIVFIGTAIWALGFVVLLPFYNELGRHHHRIWLWTCLAGVGVGLFAYVLTRRHRAAGRIN